MVGVMAGMTVVCWDVTSAGLKAGLLVEKSAESMVDEMVAM